jgi:hypothetical protein
MRSGGGHRKGAAFERHVAKMIVKAFRRYGVKQKECWRSVLSGGHEMSSGDLRMSRRMEKLFPWSVECKFRKKIRWTNLFLYPRITNSAERRWVAQAGAGADKGTSKPLLVLKENHGPILAYGPIGVHGQWQLQRFSKFLSNASNGKKH